MPSRRAPSCATGPYGATESRTPVFALRTRCPPDWTIAPDRSGWGESNSRRRAPKARDLPLAYTPLDGQGLQPGMGLRPIFTKKEITSTLRSISPAYENRTRLSRSTTGSPPSSVTRDFVCGQAEAEHEAQASLAVDALPWSRTRSSRASTERCTVSAWRANDAQRLSPATTVTEETALATLINASTGQPGIEPGRRRIWNPSGYLSLWPVLRE